MALETVNAATPINRQHPLAYGLRSFWTCQPHPSGRTGFGGSYLLDLSSNRHGTLFNGAAWVAGPNGGAIATDGTNDYIEFGDYPEFNAGTGSCSVGGWFKNGPGNTANDYPSMLSKTDYVGTGDGMSYWVRNTTDLRTYNGSAESTVDGNFAVGVWTHYLFVKAGSAMTCYKNGVQLTTWTENRTYTSTDILRIGAWGDLGGPYWNGSCAEFMYYDIAISSSNAYAIYASAVQGHPTLLNRYTRRPAVFGAGGGGSTFNVSVSESLAGSDVYTRTSDGKRSISDNFGSQDPYLRTAPASRITYDNLAGSDVYARKSDAIRPFSDSLAFPDSYQRTSTAKRSQSDNIGFPDAYARTSAANRAPSDNVGESDSFQRAANANRNISENLSSQDVFARLASALRALSDNLASTDSYQRTSTSNRSISDNLAESDAFARVASALRALSDNLGLQDAATLVKVAAGVFLIAISDSLGLSDPFLRQSTANRTASDNMGVSESVGRLVDYVRAVQDVAAFAETYARTATANRSVSDNVGEAEQFARIANANRTFTELFGMFDDPDLHLVTAGAVAALLMIRRLAVNR